MTINVFVNNLSVYPVELESINSNEWILRVYLLEVNFHVDVRVRHALLFPATSKDIYLLYRGKFNIYHSNV